MGRLEKLAPRGKKFVGVEGNWILGEKFAAAHGLFALFYILFSIKNELG
jgi:hypothetical protein